ncbi:hypothetical protein VE01_07588 [Pseudogymnoascus verrucosus]|uniref:ABM domain-containing protein n=1 Tax=Pseudogymnoascus verrucosus TaxID=342668 RepID=A0A1B8GH94_9PEZI|nr:uncharacterized protein VE01_07588 [Pseudogymnoascus verrucosus]OBT95196.1 hypothetical protein VE01_07588 [Pseudogymnoascus verrucosus]
MSQPITEIVQFKLQPNASIEDQMPEFTRLLQRQPGFLHLAWGRRVESPDNVQMLINWDTIESHHQFEKSGADYAALGVIVKSLVAEPPVVYHVNFKSDNGLVIQSTSAT